MYAKKTQVQKNIDTSISCSCTYPTVKCTPETKTPDVYFPKNNDGSHFLGEVFSYNWKSGNSEVSVNLPIELSGNVNYTLNMV